MARLSALTTAVALTASFMTFGAGAASAETMCNPVSDVDELQAVVDRVAQPLMPANEIPGMAVAITIDGQSHVFNYGLASRESSLPVDDRTLFKVGSLSKTFTGTLGAFVQATGNLPLTDPATKAHPELSGTRFDRVSLLDLATYTAAYPFSSPTR